MTQKLTFVNGAKAACGCRHEFSSGGGEYSDVASVHLCAMHAGTPVLDDRWKARMLDGRAPERDEMGLGDHPELPMLDEGMTPRSFFAALGLELAHTSAEDQLDWDVLGAMSEAVNWADWLPTPPQGDGWKLVSIFDTEDGPVAWWLRELPEAEDGTTTIRILQAEVEKLKARIARAGAAPAAVAPQGDKDDSLLLCASDLQHSAIYDSHSEMQDCARSVADRIKALAAPALEAPAAPESAPWCPDVCPITGRPFFMWIDHWQTGKPVPTYGGPYDSYTIPVKDSDGSFECERYDHDEGGWLTEGAGWHCLGVRLVDDQSFVVDPSNPRYHEIEAFAAAAPQAQASAPDWWRGRADEIEVQVAATGNSEAMRCYTDMRTLLQAAAAPQAPAAPAEAQRLAQFLQDRQTCLGSSRASAGKYNQESWDDYERAWTMLLGMAAPAAPSAIATQVIENLLQLARIVNTAVEDWGETKEDDSMEVIFHKEEADKMESILEFFDSLPDAPAEEGVIESGPLRAARVLRAQAAPAAPALTAAPVPVMPRAITAGLGLDDSGEEPAYCVMAAFRSEDDARYALSILSAGLGATAAPAAPAVDAQAERDAAFEAVRNRLCSLQRYSFVLDDDGIVRRAQDRTGNWIEFDDAHALFDPVAVDSAIAAQAKEGGA